MGFPISVVHQIEITSRCNLRCRYCPSPHLQRPKMDIEHDVYLKALRAARECVHLGRQHELNLAGIGESTMHPRFAEYVALAREAVGDFCDLVLATNGILMTPELAREIAKYAPKVWVSLHRPERAGPAVEALKSAGIFSGVSADPSVAAIDWAGQVKWHVSHSAGVCQWISTGRVMVMADGRVTTCCLDASGSGVVGTVDDLDTPELKPYDLCKSCSWRLSPSAAALE